MSDAYIRGVSREQAMLFPETVDEYVSDANVVRLIDAFVDGLSSGSDGSSLPPPREMGGEGGRKGYDPRTLAKLLVWGYVNRVRSTRRLETEAGRNVELFWLLGKLQPDHSSISRFRAANSKRIKGWLREFNLICAQLGLLAGEEIAVDGVFLKAANSKKNNHTQKELKDRIARVEARVEGYLKDLEQSEAEDAGSRAGAPGVAGPVSGEELRAKLACLGGARAELKEMLAAAEDSPSGQLSTVDPESRLLQKSAGAGVVGYLAQTAVDSKAHMIAAAEVTTAGNDSGTLARMARAASEVMPARETAEPTETEIEAEAERMRVLADGGFFQINDLVECEESGWEPAVPTYPQRKKQAEAKLYPTVAFGYDEAGDHYSCPRGETLTRHADYKSGEATYQTYYNTAACRSCPVRERCCSGKYRKIHRHSGQATVDRMSQRMESDPEIYSRRASTVEHPFGSMMFWNEGRNLLCCGQEKANAEFSLSCLAYNIKRAIRVVGISKLIEAVRRVAGGDVGGAGNPRSSGPLRRQGRSAGAIFWNFRQHRLPGRLQTG